MTGSIFGVLGLDIGLSVDVLLRVSSPTEEVDSSIHHP